MAEIKFDLGKNIHETAKASGVPQFSVSKLVGLVDYTVSNIPESVPAHYTRPGYEILWQPLAFFTLSADHDRDPNDVVETVSLKLRKVHQTHAEARAFVLQTLAQFQRGKWKRYYDPDWQVPLTGRSSLLDEKGNLARTLSTLDPAYAITEADWPAVAEQNPSWQWLGDGVLARLVVNCAVEAQGLYYTFNLYFDLLEVMLQHDATNLAAKLQRGDAQGWNSSSKHEQDKKERKELNQRLIRNAIERGDGVDPPS